jgi:hypothetical protein
MSQLKEESGNIHYNYIPSSIRALDISIRKKGRENESLPFPSERLAMMTKKKQKKKKKKKESHFHKSLCVVRRVFGGGRVGGSHNIMAGVWVARERLANATARKSLPLFPFSFLS